MVVQKPIVAGMGVLFGALTVWSTVGAQAQSPAGGSPAASNPAASNPAASSPAASSPASNVPAASVPAANVPAASNPEGNVAAAKGPADEARRILQAVEADESAHELVSRAVNQAHATLDQSAQEAAPDRREALESLALEWAQTARDLKRARDAEQASDRLEQSLSTLQTELVRTRASVEQALARVGRARQELSELERSKGTGAAPAGAPRQ